MTIILLFSPNEVIKLPFKLSIIFNGLFAYMLCTETWIRIAGIYGSGNLRNLCLNEMRLLLWGTFKMQIKKILGDKEREGRRIKKEEKKILKRNCRESFGRNWEY